MLFIERNLFGLQSFAKMWYKVRNMERLGSANFSISSHFIFIYKSVNKHAR